MSNLAPSTVENMENAQLLNTDGFCLSKIRCRVHPSVIMTMLQAHDRLSKTNGFAIGTLLGTVLNDGSKGTHSVLVEVTDCFANPFQWDRTTTALTIQKDPHEWMLKLREKVNSRLSVVGWCCTTSTILYTTALSDWAESEPKVSRFVPSKTLPKPIHILFGPTFENKKNLLSATKAYVRGPLQELFHEVQLEIAIHASDMRGVASIIQRSSCFGNEADNADTAVTPYFNSSSSEFMSNLTELNRLLAHCLKYVNAILDNKIEPDPAMGRELMRALGYMTTGSKAELETQLKGFAEDNLMITSLMNIARLQFNAAEHLSSCLV